MEIARVGLETVVRRQDLPRTLDREHDLRLRPRHDVARGIAHRDVDIREVLAVRDDLVALNGDRKPRNGSRRLDRVARPFPSPLVDDDLEPARRVADVIPAQAIGPVPDARLLPLAAKRLPVQEQLALAQRLLARGNRPVAAVARECGFTSGNQLTRVFKLRFGQSISNWQKFSLPKQHQRIPKDLG